MTIKQVWMAECDICGRTEPARAVSGRYNETDYMLPLNWGLMYNRKMCACPECTRALDERKRMS